MGNSKSKKTTTDKKYIQKKSKKDTQDNNDFLLDIMSELSYYQGKNGLCATVTYKEQKRVVDIGSREYIDYISAQYYFKGYGFADEKEIRDRLKLIRYKYIEENQSDYLFSKRYMYAKGKIYIDMANDKLEYIEVTKEGYNVNQDIDDSSLFMYKSIQLPMEYPLESDNEILLEELDEFLNLYEDDKFLLKIWLVACMNPNINTPILYFLGGSGTGKSSMQSMLSYIVDPSSRGRVNWDDASGNEMAIALDNSYVVCYDNVSKITQSKSDLLCQTVTGGKASYRKKYTDATEVTFDLRSRVIISSIRNCIKREDLAQRILFINVPKLTSNNRIREDEYEAMYKEKMGRIRGELLDVLSLSLEQYPEWQLHNTSRHRLASFYVYGSLIANILDEDKGVERFKRIMKEKFIQQIFLSSQESVIIKCMFEMLEYDCENHYRGATKKLYEKIINWIEDSPDCIYGIEDIDINYDAFCKMLHRNEDDFEILGYKMSFYSISNPHCSGIEIKKSDSDV